MLVLLAGAGLAGCEPAVRKPQTVQIVIDQLAFGAPPPELHVGDTIQWVNHDMFLHSATAKDGQFDVELPPGATAGVVLQRSGIIQYYCRYHPGMTGQLSVSS